MLHPMFKEKSMFKFVLGSLSLFSSLFVLHAADAPPIQANARGYLELLQKPIWVSFEMPLHVNKNVTIADVKKFCQMRVPLHADAQLCFSKFSGSPIISDEEMTTALQLSSPENPILIINAKEFAYTPLISGNTIKTNQ